MSYKDKCSVCGVSFQYPSAKRTDPMICIICSEQNKDQRIKELEAENKKLKTDLHFMTLGRDANLAENERLNYKCDWLIGDGNRFKARIDKLRAALEKFVWSDRPDTVPETWQEKSAKQALKEDRGEK